MSQSLGKKAKISKAPLKLPMNALLCFLVAILAILPGFLIGTSMASLLHEWFFSYRFYSEITNYFPKNNTTVLLVIVTICIISVAGIFAFLSSKHPQEIQKENNKYWTVFAAISALFLIIVGACVEGKSYIVLGTTSLIILIPIVLYTKTALKVFFIVCILICMVIGSAIIKANNIKNIHYTKGLHYRSTRALKL